MLFMLCNMFLNMTQSYKNNLNLQLQVLSKKTLVDAFVRMLFR